MHTEGRGGRAGQGGRRARRGARRAGEPWRGGAPGSGAQVLAPRAPAGGCWPRSGGRGAGVRGRGRAPAGLGPGRRPLTWARAAGSSCWRARPAWPCSSPWPSGSSRRPAPPPGPPSWRRRRRPLPPLGSAPLGSAPRPGRSVGLGRRCPLAPSAPAARSPRLTGAAAPWRRLGPGPGSLRSRRDCSRAAAAAAAARTPEPPPPPAPPAAHSASEPASGRAGGRRRRRPLEAARPGANLTPAAPQTPLQTGGDLELHPPAPTRGPGPDLTPDLEHDGDARPKTLDPNREHSSDHKWDSRLHLEQAWTPDWHFRT